MPDLPGQRQAAQEVRQIVGQSKQLQPRLVVLVDDDTLVDYLDLELAQRRQKRKGR